MCNSSTLRETTNEDVATRIASNNYQAGQLAGQYVLGNVAVGSRVAILEGLAGNSSGQARHDGFNDTVKDTANPPIGTAKALNAATF
ncbi:MAG: hypothetical protein U0175_26325 [Caldilineaceae bacterium]